MNVKKIHHGQQTKSQQEWMMALITHLSTSQHRNRSNRRDWHRSGDEGSSKTNTKKQPSHICGEQKAHSKHKGAAERGLGLQLRIVGVLGVVRHGQLAPAVVPEVWVELVLEGAAPSALATAAGACGIAALDLR